MSKQCIVLAGIAAIALTVTQPANAQQKIDASYSCKVTADGKVIVTVNNPNAFQIFLQRQLPIQDPERQHRHELLEVGPGERDLLRTMREVDRRHKIHAP